MYRQSWLLNIRADPAVTLLVKRQRVSGTARILQPADPGYDRLWDAFNISSSDPNQHYQARTSRPIPLVIIEPAPGQVPIPAPGSGTKTGT